MPNLPYGTEAPGQGPSYRDASSANLILERRAFYFAFLREIGDKTILAIQDYFLNDPSIPDEWRWEPTTETHTDGTECLVTGPDSPILIGADGGEFVERYPSILLSDVSMDINDLWLGQKMATMYIKNPLFVPGNANSYEDDIPRVNPELLEVGERIGGNTVAHITFKIRGNTRPERDAVADILLRGFVSPIRRKLNQLALNWMPNSGKIGNEAIEDITNTRKVYVRTFSFSLRAEWYEDFYFQAVTVEDVTCVPTTVNP